MSWWRRRRHRDRIEDELDAELRDHVERQVADHVRAGMAAPEARRRARLEFGGLDQVKEMCRDARGTRWIEDSLRDVRYALRRLVRDRSPGVTVVAIGALAIGMGASVAMFSVLDAVVLEPLPFPHQERLVAGWKTSRTDPSRFIELSYPEFLEWHAQSTSFESLAALPTTVYGYSYVLTGRGDPVAIESSRVTSEFFDALGVPPLLGRTFVTTDGREGAQPTVVLTHAFWTNVLGADPGVIGSGLTLTGVDFTVIGVLPAAFVFPQGVDVFTALGTRPGLANNRTVFLQVLGRLRPDVSRRQAAAELDGIVSRFEARQPGSTAGTRMAALTPLRDHILGSGQVIAALLFTGAVVLLLVAGVNLSGLLATRAARRGGEVALRLGLGASTRHLLQQFVAEGLVLTTIGTIVGPRCWPGAPSPRRTPCTSPPPSLTPRRRLPGNPLPSASRWWLSSARAWPVRCTGPRSTRSDDGSWVAATRRGGTASSVSWPTAGTAACRRPAGTYSCPIRRPPSR